jgi:hypothetical protein
METGSLVLFDGEPIFTCPVRGKADSQRAKNRDNRYRDPKLPWGDTPAGLYKPAEWVSFVQPHKSFGTGFLPLVGASGDALKAVENGRTGLGLHGGAGECLELPGKLYLKATYGCLRVRDSDLNHLMQLTAGEEIEVTVFDR